MNIDKKALAEKLKHSSKLIKKGYKRHLRPYAKEMFDTVDQAAWEFKEITGIEHSKAAEKRIKKFRIPNKIKDCSRLDFDPDFYTSDDSLGSDFDGYMEGGGKPYKSLRKTIRQLKDQLGLNLQTGPNTVQDQEYYLIERQFRDFNEKI